ncbi:MAG: hypothetical protein L0G39_23245, partial [Chryseobacterium sp.]|nr:hypothetical protein [Chryseobacterium sp.]
MSKNNYLRFIYLSLAIASGILCYHFFLIEKWINVLLFSTLTLILILLVNSSFLSQIAKTERIVQSIIKKDFSLFPKQEGSELINS